MKRQESPWWSEGFTREWWFGLKPDDRELFLSSLSDEEITDFFYDWRVWARDKQLLPDGFEIYDLVCGRGFGKTKTAVETINEWVEVGWSQSLAIVGQGDADIRRVMIEGNSGFLKTARPGARPRWSPSVNGGQLVWPNGATALVFSAEDPEGLRGPEYDTAWFDEPMACPAKKREETMSNIRFGLRMETMGVQPRLIRTMTPKKHKWMKTLLIQAAAKPKRIWLVQGSTYENAENLPKTFIDGIRDDFEGTRLGQQEIHGQLLGDDDAALWTETLLEECRERVLSAAEIVERAEKVVVAVDPNIQSDETAHEAGVIVVAKVGRHRYVLADRSCKGGPLKWGTAAVQALIDFNADEIIGEANQGGQMVKLVIVQAADELERDVKVHLVYATKGKTRRAEPAATAYERKRVHHVGDPEQFKKLEEQMTSLHDGLDPTGEDFDRCDALVWGLHRLKVKSLGKGSSGGAQVYAFAEFRGAA